MDANRHKADSEEKYEAYFKLLHSKIAEYGIEPRHTYNMDEKGFMLGVLGRSKRVFSRRSYEKKEVTAALQDGSRLIYSSANSSIRSAWVSSIEAGQHDVFIASSPSGWTNNDIGLAWLEQVFERCTKQKARRGRDWRLIILDGHGSHVTPDFLDYCDSHRILLAIFPPHSTHTLQSLDVVLFKPLSTAYSAALSDHLHKSQGLLPVKKGDFFSLFWSAWQSAFKTETVLKSFEATGIWPMEPERILERFTHTPPEDGRSSSSILSDSDWRKMNQLNQLLHHELNGVKEAITVKKRHKKHSKPLDLQQRQEYHSGAVFWSPRKIREARARERVKQQEEHEQQLAKANKKELQAAAKLLRHQEAEERRVAREAAKVVKEKERAEKAAARAARIEAQATKRASQTTQDRKRKALVVPSSRTKRQKRGGRSTATAASTEAAPAAPPKTSSRGRTIKTPSKYR
ncbi:DDE-1 domain containing protein [Pyrenophora tritici-repentis]|nr:DDE-1 domain containing protein [Pyrenophora tritici-repentis]